MGCNSVWEAIQQQAEFEASPIPTHEATDAPVKEVILKGKDVDLDILPITVHNELDAGLFVCSGATIVKDPITGAHNTGIYRHQVFSQNELGYFVNPSHHGNYVRVHYEELNEPMPVAIAIGHHPAMLMSATSQTPGIGGEYELMGALMGESVALVKAETQDIMVPAEAEIVIEGYVKPGHKRDEGPFGEYPWYYTGTGERPVITVTAITMRRDAIYQDINAAHPEHNTLGMIPKAGSVWRRIKETVPHAVAMNMPISGCSRLHCYVSIRKRADGEPKQAAFAALAAEANLKMVVIVDDDVDVFNEQEVLWAVATRFEADRDLIVMPNCLGAHLDPSAYDITRLKHGAMATKLILDATKPAPPTTFPPRALVPADVVERMRPEEYLEEYRPLATTRS
jgi:2,5-furandicarboxylate decarboxylase 1